MTRRNILFILALSIFTAIIPMLLKHLTRIPATLTMSKSIPSSQKQAIIVGSGLAGLSAASQLITHGITVTVLERSAKPGGNSVKASSGINGAPTKYQPGPPLSDTMFYDDTVRSAGKVLSTSRTSKSQREGLIATLTNSSSSAISWLANEKGVDLSAVAQLGGHSFPRTHRGAGKTPPGAAIVATLLKSLKESPLFHLETGCVVTKVVKTEGGVDGVEYMCEDERRVHHGPVIFASGGFAGDANGMLAQYRPDLAGFPSTNDPRPGSQTLLTDVGAQVLDMQQVQVHPTSFVDTKDPFSPVKFLAAELLRGEGGLLLHDGKRFANEVETRKHVTDAITLLPAAVAQPRQWDVQIVLDEGVYERVASHLDFYLWKGLMRKTTVGELGADSLSSLRAYADAAAGLSTDPLGRQQFGHWKLRDVKPESIVYVGRVTPAAHFTMGGVAINDHSEVLNKDGNAIPGLWAAGEVTGGIHGENRLGGSSLLECVVFGRTAGDGVAKYLE